MTVDHRKGNAADMFDTEEGEFPRENGEHQNNGVGIEMGPDRIADKHPDEVDDIPGKSRCISPFYGITSLLFFVLRVPRFIAC